MSAAHIIVVGAGAAGLMAARELARAGRRVTILEARERCGGRILPLPTAEFGYRAEGGPEFIHGEAPVTRGLLREAGLGLLPIEGTRWSVEGGVFSRRDDDDPHAERLQQALAALDADLPIAAFLRQHFAAPQYDRMRRNIERMVEGYDAADPEQASTLVLAEEWMREGLDNGGRIAGGYGGLVDFLTEDCRKHGAVLHLNAAVAAIETAGQGIVARCANGDTHAGDAAILTLPVPLLREIALPAPARAIAAAAAGIGFGNVIKTLLRFKTRWWAEKRRGLADLAFLRSEEPLPVFWTQHPIEHPVLTGWFGGPRTQHLAQLDENALIALALRSLAAVFGLS